MAALDELKAEKDELEKRVKVFAAAIALLEGGPAKKRQMSPEARAKISSAQKKRWAKTKKADA
jgi:hypothetical protein